MERDRATSDAGTWIRAVAWLILALLGAINAWGQRHAMNPDGIAYLDMARSLAHGDWSQGINAYWSPLFPWALSLALRVFGDSPYLEFTIAHMTNFVFFMLALGAFELCLRQLLRARAHSTDARARTLPFWLCEAVAYVSFGWSTLVIIGLGFVTPDMALAACVYLAAAILVRLYMGGRPVIWLPALGATLAIGYLTKAAMLPLAAVFLALAPLANPRFRVRDLAFGGLCFGVVAAPFVLALSLQKHHFTLGDTGKLNYAWFVDGVQPYKHWHGEPAGSGTPRHPSHIIYPTPVTYEFSEPVKGTFPVWDDPSYWHEGLRTNFQPWAQIKRLFNELRELIWMLGDLFIAVAAFLVLVLRRKLSLNRRLFALGAIPAVAAMGMYSLVHVELRFIGAFLGTLVVFSVFALKPAYEIAREAVLVVWCALALLHGARVTQTSLSAAADIRAQIALGDRAHPQWRYAAELKRAGLQSGEEIALVGNSFRAYWAHLNRNRIVGEIGLQAFWQASPEQRARAIDALRRVGVSQILMVTKNGCASDQGWVAVPHAPLCIYAARGGS